MTYLCTLVLMGLEYRQRNLIYILIILINLFMINLSLKHKNYHWIPKFKKLKEIGEFNHYSNKTFSARQKERC